MLIGTTLVYNEAHWLPIFLENITPQLDCLLMLDGGSTDGSWEILWSWSATDPDNRKLYRWPQRGDPYSVSWQEEIRRNFLLDEATQEGRFRDTSQPYVVILDADELVPDDFRDRLLPVLAESPETDIVVCPMLHFWGGLHSVRIDSPDDPNWYPTPPGKGPVVRCAPILRFCRFTTSGLHGQLGANGDPGQATHRFLDDLPLFHLRWVTPAHQKTYGDSGRLLEARDIAGQETWGVHPAYVDAKGRWVNEVCLRPFAEFGLLYPRALTPFL
jgi:hypothetical protein